MKQRTGLTDREIRGGEVNAQALGSNECLACQRSGTAQLRTRTDGRVCGKVMVVLVVVVCNVARCSMYVYVGMSTAISANEVAWNNLKLASVLGREAVGQGNCSTTLKVTRMMESLKTGPNPGPKVGRAHA